MSKGRRSNASLECGTFAALGEALRLSKAWHLRILALPRWGDRMTIALMFALIPITAYAILNMIGIVVSKGKRKKRALHACATVLLGLTVLVAILSIEDSKAREEGFADAKTMNQAHAFDIHDPAEWERRKDTLLAEREARWKRDALTAKAAAAKPDDDENTKCKADISCWGEKAWRVSGGCETAIEKLAKWDFEWTDSWSEPKFSHYRWRDQQQGVVTLLGDRIKMQNGFGAWKRVSYSCDVDPVTHAIIDAQVYEE